VTKVDLKRTIPSYRAPRGAFEVVEVPPLRYLMVDGHGDPNTTAQYADAVAALFGTAYRLKFLSKTELGRDYVVMPLEGLWWSDDMATFTTSRDKSRWSWTMMILVPEWIEDVHVERARRAAAEKAIPPPSAPSGSEISRRAPASRRCTSARTTTRRRSWPTCTSGSSRRMGCA
jgi:hypothetical protein